MNNNKAVNKAVNSTSNNIVKKASNTYKNSSSTSKIIFFVVLVAFILFIIYLIYSATVAANAAKAESPIIVNDVLDAYVARPSFALPTPTTGMTQSFSTWIYVKDWNYKFGQYKNILWRGNPPNTSSNDAQTFSGNTHSPSLWLYPLTNSLKVVTSTTSNTGIESCDIQNIPLLAWVHIAYVLNNRTVDIYINGQLERSCALQGVPIISSDPVYITSGNPSPGYYGKIGKTQYFTKALLPNEVADMYQKGPLGTSMYQVNFFTDGKIVSLSDTNSLTAANSS